MKLTINGEERDLPDAATVRDVVVAMGLGKAIVAVEKNKQVIPKKAHESTPVAEGDVIELVTLVGGG